jgi:hypothetical protein
LLTGIYLGASQRVERGAGEGELIFDLTGHGATVTKDDLVEQGEIPARRLKAEGEGFMIKNQHIQR